MSVDRKPAITRPKHPAEDLPERPPKRTSPQMLAPNHTELRTDAARPAGERFSDQFNTKMRPSTRAALDEAVSVAAFRSGTKTSMQALVDSAILEYIDRYDLRRPR